jgi:hypothetical protein
VAARLLVDHHDVEITAIGERPRLYVIDDFASEAETEHVVAIVSERERLEQHAQSWERDKNSFVAELSRVSDATLARIAARSEALLGTCNDRGESLRLRAYVPGEAHGLHTDSYQDGDAILVATALLYLVDVEAGGGTRFPHARPQPVTITPRRGRLLLWFGHLEDGSLDPCSAHESLPVEAGHKLVLNNFIYKPLDYCLTIPSLPICPDHREQQRDEDQP